MVCHRIGNKEEGKIPFFFSIQQEQASLQKCVHFISCKRLSFRQILFYNKIIYVFPQFFGRTFRIFCTFHYFRRSTGDGYGFCAMFVVPAALSLEAEEIPSIASVIFVIEATSSSEVALKSETRSLIFAASRL